MIDYDAVLKKLLKARTKYEKAHGIEDKSSCLSDELFTEYFENVLSPYKRKKVQEHLCSCESCRKMSIILHNAREVLAEKSLQKAPAAFTKRAKDLVARPLKPSPIEVIIAVLKDTLEIVKYTASLISPIQPARETVRFTEKPGTPANAFAFIIAKTTNIVDTVSFSTNFADISAYITVVKAGGRACRIEVKTLETVFGNPVSNIRLTLLSKGRELISKLTVTGHTAFEPVAPGKYTLEIKRELEVLGSIALTLKAM